MLLLLVFTFYVRLEVKCLLSIFLFRPDLSIIAMTKPVCANVFKLAVS